MLRLGWARFGRYGHAGRRSLMLPPCVLAIDPGMMTGLAWLAGGRDFHAGEYGFMEAGTLIERTCQAYGQNLWILWERYDIDTRRPQQDAHHALEMIGVARRYSTLHLCRQLPPAAPGQRKVATRQMLQAIGWWPAGKDDAQSAAQHMLAWLLREHEVPPQQRAVLDRLTERTG